MKNRYEVRFEMPDGSFEVWMHRFTIKAKALGVAQRFAMSIGVKRKRVLVYDTKTGEPVAAYVVRGKA